MSHQRKFSKDHSQIEGEIGGKELRIKHTSHMNDNFPRGLIPKEIENL